MVQAIRTARGPGHDIYILNGWLLVDDFEMTVDKNGKPDLLPKQRMELWSEHLGMPASTFIDGVTSAGHWLTLPASAHVTRCDPNAGIDKFLGKPISDERCEQIRYPYIEPDMPAEGIA